MNCKCQTEKHAMQCLHNFFFQFLSEWQSAIQSRGFSSLFFSFSPIEQEVANRPSVYGPSFFVVMAVYTQTHNNKKTKEMPPSICYQHTAFVLMVVSAINFHYSKYFVHVVSLVVFFSPNIKQLLVSDLLQNDL